VTAAARRASAAGEGPFTLSMRDTRGLGGVFCFCEYLVDDLELLELLEYLVDLVTRCGLCTTIFGVKV